MKLISVPAWRFPPDESLGATLFSRKRSGRMDVMFLAFVKESPNLHYNQLIHMTYVLSPNFKFLSTSAFEHEKKFATPPREFANFYFIEKPLLIRLPYACDLLLISVLNIFLYKNRLLQRLLLVYLLQQ